MRGAGRGAAVSGERGGQAGGRRVDGLSSLRRVCAGGQEARGQCLTLLHRIGSVGP